MKLKMIISKSCRVFFVDENDFTFSSVHVMCEDGEWYYFDYDGKFHTSKP